MRAFRKLNGAQTLAYLKAQKFTLELAQAAKASEAAHLNRPEVVKAFDEYLKWLALAVRPEDQATPVAKSKGKKKEA